MHGVRDGVNRDRLMARHEASHIQLAYANDPDAVHMAAQTKACLAAKLGVDVSWCWSIN